MVMLKIEVKCATHFKNSFFTEITGSFKAVQTLRMSVQIVWIFYFYFFKKFGSGTAYSL